uniref:Uncharacterized protein n=1 Tax=Geospiza parvula TaxID=87175 RepID=A0A8C3N5M5_GEOPR
EQSRTSLGAAPEPPAGVLRLLWLLVGCDLPPVLESPESSEEQMVAEGSDVTFTCKATGSPAPSVTWLKNGEPLGQQGPQVPGGPQLSLVAVAPADAGIYSCLVVNEAGEVSKAFHLVVMGALGACAWLMGTGTGVPSPP